MALEKGAGPGDDEGNPHEGFVEAATFAGEAVIAEHFAVVAREDDHGVFALARALKCIEHAADVFVDEGDHAVVRRFVVLFAVAGRVAFLPCEKAFESRLCLQVAFAK